MRTAGVSTGVIVAVIAALVAGMRSTADAAGQLLAESTGVASYMVRGKVKIAGGKGIAGVAMNFTRVSGTGDTPAAVSTNAKGKWQQGGFAAGAVYRVTPVKAGYSFDPPNRQVSKAGAANFVSVDAAAIAWVRIPAGRFQMGCTPSDSDCSSTEAPRHQVKVGAFQMAATETTNAQYQACVTAAACAAVTSEGGSDYPVVGVNWHDAAAFCQWSAARLPSEAEREYASRGGRNDWKYPWGSSISNDNANYYGMGGRDKWTRSAPVKSFEPNSYGLYDIAGNVWEWVQDNWHADYVGAPGNGSAWSTGGTTFERVLRGGSWLDNAWYLRVSARHHYHTDSSSFDGGFRCVR